MPHVLALEWDDAEARIAVADVRRGSIVLEQAFAVSLADTAPGSGGGTPGGQLSLSGAHDLHAIGRRITEALSNRGIRRGKTLVGVGRANIELKNLTVPPSPPEELADMVRFQAERDFNTLSEDWPLDFLPLPSEEGEPLNVLAAAISPELVAEIEVTCQAANLTPQRLMLRPCAAAALLSRVRPGQENKLRLLVDLLAEEADLTVLSGDVVVFMRTARMPQEAIKSDNPLRVLLPEIRRTIAAVHNRMQGQRIEEMFFCGDSDAQAATVREISRELDLPVEVFNPLKSCTLGGDLRRELPSHPSRFAPLIGMLLHEAAPSEGMIDFLNPRKRPEAKSRKREFTMIGVAAGLLIASTAGWIWYQLGEMDAEIAMLTQKSNQMGEGLKDRTDTPVKKAMGKTAQAAETEKFLTSEVVWLDELAALAVKAPPAKDVMITHLTTPTDALRRMSKMHLDVAVTSTEVAERLQAALRDKGHQVALGPSEQLESAKHYPWSIKVDLQIDPSKNDLATALAEKGIDVKAGSAKSENTKSNGKSEGPQSNSPPQNAAPGNTKQPPADKPAAESKPAGTAPASAKEPATP
jgi:Tfp pilus assembly PilM family ATPase